MCNLWRHAPCVNLGQIFLSGSVTAAVTQWHWAESSPTEDIALHINRFVSMPRNRHDSSERERSSFGPESILAKNSLMVSFTLPSFYLPLYLPKLCRKVHSKPPYVTDTSVKMWNFLLFNFFKKYWFLAVQILWRIRLSVSLLFPLLHWKYVSNACQMCG